MKQYSNTLIKCLFVWLLLIELLYVFSGKFTKQVSMGGNHVFGPLLVVGIQRLGGGDGKKNETKFKNCLSVFVEKGDSQVLERVLLDFSIFRLG